MIICKICGSATNDAHLFIVENFYAEYKLFVCSNHKYKILYPISLDHPGLFNKQPYYNNMGFYVDYFVNDALSLLKVEYFFNNDVIRLAKMPIVKYTMWSIATQDIYKKDIYFGNNFNLFTNNDINSKRLEMVMNYG